MYARFLYIFISFLPCIASNQPISSPATKHSTKSGTATKKNPRKQRQKQNRTVPSVDNTEKVTLRIPIKDDSSNNIETIRVDVYKNSTFTDLINDLQKIVGDGTLLVYAPKLTHPGQNAFIPVAPYGQDTLATFYQKIHGQIPSGMHFEYQHATTSSILNQ